MKEKARIEVILPIWLYDKTFEITKIYHYPSRTAFPLIKIESYKKYTGILKLLIDRLKCQLIENQVTLNNKTVYEIKFFRSDGFITLYCGFYDDNFTIGLGATTESISKPSEVHLFKKKDSHEE